ncbi:MAG: 16S rRNA processing protein RimM [Firmicutes bacterium HGW-Firmicutes-16]|nr:MAG: 16S rRNA processing protein RimM [Firmicutes bacterium HGW-Firmicutes-16]
MKKYLEAGVVANTHGIKGEVKIQPWADSAEFLMGFKRLYIDEKPFELVSGKVHKDCLIAQFEGVSDINTAMILKGKIVSIDRAEAKLPKGSFFIQDLIGASVRDEGGAELGKLTDVLELPAGNVYVVTGEREILIPAVPQFILKTDVDAGIVTVRLIDGM